MQGGPPRLETLRNHRTFVEAIASGIFFAFQPPDCRNKHSTSYTYSLAPSTTITDANGRQTTYLYDDLGNMTSAVDRNGNETDFTRDDLNRVTQVAYKDGSGNVISTISYTYDLGNRMTQAADTASAGPCFANGNSITRTYDGLDRILT